MATIKDIARMAGVSVSTVSHVVNGTRYVSPEKVERVKKAIGELDQLPNFIAKRKMPPTGLEGEKYVLLLLSDRHSIFQRQVSGKLEELLEEKGFAAIAQYYGPQGERLALCRTLLSGPLKPAGVVAFPDRRGGLTGPFLKGLGLPVVLIGGRLEGLEADTLLPDTFEGCFRAVRHLVKSGHERIAYLCQAETRGSRRFEGYRKALEDSGLPLQEDLVFPGLKTEEDVRLAMRKAVQAEPAPTALVAADSLPLIPALRFLNARHIPVPEEMSVVSLNDLEWAPLSAPELTCVDRQPEKFAAAAAELLLKRMEQGESANMPRPAPPYCQETIPSLFNVRASTCGIGRGPFGERAESATALALSEEEKERLRQKGYTAAISFHYTGKAWMRLQEKGIKRVFRDLGISIIAVTDAHFDAKLQCKQLESLRFLKPDVLISIPVDGKDTAEAFRAVAESHTKLVLITNVPEGFTHRDYVSCISVNEHSHGSGMGRGLGEYMVRHGLKHAGLVCHGEQNFFATKQRDSAAEQALTEEYPEIHVCGRVDFLTEAEAYKKTLEFVRLYPELQALYVSWDGPALEVMRALTQAGRTDIVIVTGDLDYAIAMNLAQGGMVKMLSAQCPYEQGEAIALAAANGLLGKEVPSFIGVEPVSVNRENLLKSWRGIFKEEPPVELCAAVQQASGQL